MNPGGILITGATGFAGRHLVRHLLHAGRPLILAVRRADSCPRAWRGHPGIRIVETGAIETASGLGQALDGAAAVVHLAGLAHVAGAAATQTSFDAANDAATERLARAAADAGIATFIHLGSIAAVAPNAAPAIVDDDTGGEPVTPYGRSKLAAEHHVCALAQKGAFAVSLRPPLIVGPDARGNWGALQRLAATGLPLPFASVRNRRSLIGVDSLAGAIRHLLATPWPAALSGSYCVADEESLSLPRIVSELRSGMGMQPRLVSFPPAILYAAARLAGRERLAAGLLGDLVVDASRFRKTFGFEELRGLPAAIRNSGALYRRMRAGGGREAA